MGKRIANAKSAYSRKDLKKKRKKELTTPAANSRLVMPWTLGAPSKTKERKRATWNETANKRNRGDRTSRSRGSRGSRSTRGPRSLDTMSASLAGGSSMRSAPLRMMPSITSGFDTPGGAATASGPFMTKSQMESTYSSAIRDATASRTERGSGEGRAMAAWEEIKSWSIWDMPLAPKSMRTLDPRAQLNYGRGSGPGAAADESASATLKKSATAPGGIRIATNEQIRAEARAAAARSMTYDSHTHYKTKPRKTTKPLTGSGTRFVGGDVALVQEKRRLNDGAQWTVKASEVGHHTHLQDDVMAGFRIDALQADGGPRLMLELTVEQVKELASNWEDKIISSALARCRVIPKTRGRLFQRLTSLRITDIGSKVTAAQWEEESNRARYLRRRLGRFLLDRLLVDTSGEFLQLAVDYGEVEEDDSRVTWRDMDGAEDAAGDEDDGVGDGGSTLGSLPDSTDGGAGGGDGDDLDTFSVFVSCMGAEGEAVVGANVMIVDSTDTALARGVSDSVGQCRLRCTLVDWQTKALRAVVQADDGSQGETGLLTATTPIDAHVLLMPAED